MVGLFVVHVNAVLFCFILFFKREGKTFQFSLELLLSNLAESSALLSSYWIINSCVTSVAFLWTNQLRERAKEPLSTKKLHEFTPSTSSLHSSKVKRLICCTCPTQLEPMWYDWLKTLTFPALKTFPLTCPILCDWLKIQTHGKSNPYVSRTHLQAASPPGDKPPINFFKMIEQQQNFSQSKKIRVGNN